MMLLVLSLAKRCNGKAHVRHQVMCLSWRTGDGKMKEERVQGMVGILVRSYLNPDWER
jgi:hypothetical protein